MKKRHIDDSDIAGMFQTMQRADRAQVPSFDRIWVAAQINQSGRRRTVLFRYAMVAAVLIMVGGSYFALTDRQISPALALSISEWQSPTQPLLRVPDLAVAPRSTSVSEWQSPTEGLLGQDETTKLRTPNPEGL